MKKTCILLIIFTIAGLLFSPALSAQLPRDRDLTVKDGFSLFAPSEAHRPNTPHILPYDFKRNLLTEDGISPGGGEEGSGDGDDDFDFNQPLGENKNTPIANDWKVIGILTVLYIILTQKRQKARIKPYFRRE